MILPLSAVAAPYAALVMDARTGEVLHARNADTRLHPASLTKMMTLYIAFQAVERGEISLDTDVRISRNAASEPPSKLGLRAGQTIKLRYLIRAAAVKSANDAATALGEALEGSEAAFADLMNRTAISLGMRQSNFKNAHGLTEEGQYSTALDLALLAREVTKIPFYRECMRTQEYPFQFPDGRIKTLTNTNKVLKRLPYCTGMKTGYTRAAGRCLVSSGVLNGKAVIVVALGSTTAEIWNDSEKLLRRHLEGRASNPVAWQ